MPVYLDHAATTPLRPEVLDAMTPLLGGVFGNPSSPHTYGRVAREALDDAHERLARSIGGDAREIVFTSGGTEANNLALKGAAWAGKSRGHRIVTTPVASVRVAPTADESETWNLSVASRTRSPTTSTATTPVREPAAIRRVPLRAVKSETARAVPTTVRNETVTARGATRESWTLSRAFLVPELPSVTDASLIHMVSGWTGGDRRR